MLFSVFLMTENKKKNSFDFAPLHHQGASSAFIIAKTKKMLEVVLFLILRKMTIWSCVTTCEHIIVEWIVIAASAF